jgi:hypothetical protein
MFRKVPPITLLEDILRSLKVSSLEEKHWFSKDEISMDSLEEWLPILEPYYLPCKAERYINGDMTQSRIITVLRHILKAHQIPLNVQERVVNGKKATLYQIFYNETNPTVSFD